MKLSEKNTVQIDKLYCVFFMCTLRHTFYDKMKKRNIYTLFENCMTANCKKNCYFLFKRSIINAERYKHIWENGFIFLNMFNNNKC